MVSLDTIPYIKEIKDFFSFKMKKTYTGKKRYYYYKRKTFNNAIRNYNRARFDKAYTIFMTSQGIKFDTGETTIDISKVLENSPDFQMYRQLYQSFKISGIALLIVFGLHSSTIGGIVSPTVSLLTASDGVNFGNTVEADRSIMLGFDGWSHRSYYNMHGGLTGWISLDDLADVKPKIGVAVSNNPTQGEAYWTMKVSIWCMFKNKN